MESFMEVAKAQYWAVEPQEKERYIKYSSFFPYVIANFDEII
jgi:hypothetical protein